MKSSRATHIFILWAESVSGATGGSAHLGGLLEGLRARNVNVRVRVPVYKNQKSSLDDPAIKGIHLPKRNLFSFALLQMLTVFLLPYWLIKYRPDAVYVRTCFLAFMMAVICWLAGVPLIGEVDGVVDEEATMRGQWTLTSRLIKWLDCLNYRCVDGLACVTPGIRDEVVRRGAKPRTAVVIHNAAQIDLMKPQPQVEARKIFNLDPDAYIVGFAGTFAPWQGLDLLIQSAGEIIRQADRPVQFVLMGGGQCKQQLVDMVESFQLSGHFQFLPPVSREKVPVFNNACDLVVIPIHDPRKLRYGLSPLKFWDAVCVGVPVLVPEGAGLEEVFQRLGLPGTFLLDGPDALSEAILDVLKQTRTYQSRRKEVHRIVCENYSWTCAARKLMSLYETIKCGKGRAG